MNAIFKYCAICDCALSGLRSILLRFHWAMPNANDCALSGLRVISNNYHRAKPDAGDLATS